MNTARKNHRSTLLNALSLEEKKLLWEYLKNYLTPRRRQIFEKVIENRTYFLTVAVEDIYQERNASAVVRTAECFGIQSVHIIENRHEYKIAKGIAKGADKWLDIYIYDKKGQNNSAECLQTLKKQGYRLVAATPHEKTLLIHELELDAPIAFIMGGEKEGLTQTVLEMADSFVKIPIYGFTESYNISVATEIILYETTRRLRQSNVQWKLTEAEKIQVLLEWALKSISRSNQILQEYMQKQNLLK
ncbi:MAG: TrmH family RNA methyltransferase [Pyrinomonadaceae bacterium]